MESNSLIMQPKIFLFWICLLRTHYHPINKNKYLHTWPLYVIQSCPIINRRNIKKHGKIYTLCNSWHEIISKMMILYHFIFRGKFSSVLLYYNLISCFLRKWIFRLKYPNHLSITSRDVKWQKHIKISFNCINTTSKEFNRLCVKL